MGASVGGWSEGKPLHFFDVYLRKRHVKNSLARGREGAFESAKEWGGGGRDLL